MTQVTERVSERAGSITESSKEFVEEHALQSAFVVFGIGVGAGLVIASLLGESMQVRQTTMTQRLGQQMLDAMSNVVPNALAKRG